MPTTTVIDILPAWLESLASPLQNLTIVCKVGIALGFYPIQILSPKKTQDSTAVTDTLLEQISEHLSGLDVFHLAGCQRVTHEGFVNALLHNRNGIRSLSMEDNSPLLVRCHALPGNGV